MSTGISQDHTQKSPDAVSNIKFNVCLGVPIVTGNTYLRDQNLVSHGRLFMQIHTYWPSLYLTSCPPTRRWIDEFELWSSCALSSSQATRRSLGIRTLCFRNSAAYIAVVDVSRGFHFGFRIWVKENEAFCLCLPAMNLRGEYPPITSGAAAEIWNIRETKARKCNQNTSADRGIVVTGQNRGTRMKPAWRLSATGPNDSILSGIAHPFIYQP